MGFLSRFFKKPQLNAQGKPKQPEEYYEVTVTGDFIRVEHPGQKIEEILWADIETITLVNTNQGPWFPDIWLALEGKGPGCYIPQGSKGFDEVFEIVSKYEGFNFENFGKSMTCTDNVRFPLWAKYTNHSL